MIELRWAKKVVKAPDPCCPEYLEEVIVRRLQYRTFVAYMDASGALNISPGRVESKWTDWIDVPEVYCDE